MVIVGFDGEVTIEDTRETKTDVTGLRAGERKNMREGGEEGEGRGRGGKRKGREEEREGEGGGEIKRKKYYLPKSCSEFFTRGSKGPCPPFGLTNKREERNDIFFLREREGGGGEGRGEGEETGKGHNGKEGI